MGRVQVWKCSECETERAYGMIVLPDAQDRVAFIRCETCDCNTKHGFSHMDVRDDRLYPANARRAPQVMVM